MATAVFTFIGLTLIILAMSVGVIFGRKPIKGSCGGMSAVGVDTVCNICGGNPQKCDEQQPDKKEQKNDLGFELKSNK